MLRMPSLRVIGCALFSYALYISLARASTSDSSGPTTPDDIATMTERRLTFIVADAGDPSDINQWLSTIGDNGKWPDSEIDYTTGCDARRANWPAQVHWQRILTMAAAWHGSLTGAEQFIKTPTLLEAISSAMDYWFENDFTNPSCLDSGGAASCPCGTPGFWNTNWFSNVIGIPDLIAQSCLLVGVDLTDTQHSNCTNITGRTDAVLSHRINGLGIATGANLLDIAKIGIDNGLLNRNTTIIADAYSHIHNEVLIENAVASDGIRADGSFGQHGGILYNGNYGKDFTGDVLVLELDAAGTQFAAGDATKAAFATLIDGDQWMIFRNVLTGVLHWDFSALGRFISFPVIDEQATGSIKIDLSQVAQLGEEWDSSTLTTVVASLSENSDTANVGNLVGNRMFFANDYMGSFWGSLVQRGPGYVTTVKMYSHRTKNTECTNAQNPFGFHLSDGTVYTYMQGNEYEDIAAAWDWNLIPGITVDYAETTLSCGEAGFTGLNSFVGGASTGTIGAAAMMFTNPLTRSLNWQKAWFFLDNDVQHVMIPTISSSTDASVFSVLDQKRHNGEVVVNGTPLGQETNFTRAQSLWHDNVGYVFDQNNTAAGLSVEVGQKSGDWAAIGISTQGVETVDLFAAWLDHGSGTPIVPVSYTVFPAVNQEMFQKKTASTQLQTIQNDQDVSAVYDAPHSTAMFIFWNPSGSSTTFMPSPSAAPITVSSSGNAAVIYQLGTGNVTVSDPSQSLGAVAVTFSVGAEGERPSGWGPDLSRTLQFTLPQGGLAGSSVFQQL